ncbi:MAG TPA: ABC transporter substrate-binding protein [Synergistales bacterium]|nr:ABC transporter substrate-binding protein [Synergistales bacterium]
MKKALYLICLLVLLAASAAWAAEPIKIGKLAALTGPGATWGEHYKNVSILAVEEINAKGGLLGRPVELIVYDTKGRAEDTVNAARRMILQDKVVAIAGTNYSGLQIAIRPISEQYKVPIMATSATNPAVTVDPEKGTPYPYSFRICFTDPYQGKIMAEFLANNLKIKEAVIFHDVGSDYAEGMKQFFVATYTKAGGKVAGLYGYREGDVDFRAQITQAKATGAKAVVLPGLYKEMALIIKQCEEMGWKPVFIGGDGYSPAMYEIAGKAMEGTYWVTHIAFDDPILKPLIEKYTKRFGKPPVEIVSITLGYDAMYAIFDAIKRAGKAEGPAIAAALEKTKGLKLLDFTLNMDPKTHDPLNKPGAILKIENGKEILYTKVTPKN